MMFGIFFRQLCFTVVLFVLGVQPCLADCTTGTISSCGNTVSLSISNLVQITDIEDLNFGTIIGNSDKLLDDDVCIWTNVTAGTYKVKALGNGVDDAFTVSSSGQTIPYSVKWNNATGTSGNFALSKGTFSSLLSGANTSSNNCGGGTNANFQVRFLQSDLLSVRPGVYTGVLTLIISP